MGGNNTLWRGIPDRRISDERVALLGFNLNSVGSMPTADELHNLLCEVQASRSAWQPISTHPRDDKPFLGISADDRWPQPMKWVSYSAEDAEEIGEDGYWTYCEELIADVAGGAGPVWWRPMIDLPSAED